MFESQDYMCGAEEGLGCGLVLAPMLADLDRLAGVEESRTSWSGRFIRIELEPDADVERVASAAAAVVGGEPHRAPAVPREGHTAGERWLNSDETVQLSRHEAGVLAADFSSELSGEVGVGGATAAEIETILREELTRVFEEAHAAGGGLQRLWEGFPDARVRFEERVAPLLDAQQRERLAGYLEREMSR